MLTARGPQESVSLLGCEATPGDRPRAPRGATDTLIQTGLSPAPGAQAKSVTAGGPRPLVRVQGVLLFQPKPTCFRSSGQVQTCFWSRWSRARCGPREDCSPRSEGPRQTTAPSAGRGENAASSHALWSWSCGWGWTGDKQAGWAAHPEFASEDSDTQAGDRWARELTSRGRTSARTPSPSHPCFPFDDAEDVFPWTLSSPRPRCRCPVVPTPCRPGRVVSRCLRASQPVFCASYGDSTCPGMGLLLTLRWSLTFSDLWLVVLIQSGNSPALVLVKVLCLLLLPPTGARPHHMVPRGVGSVRSSLSPPPAPHRCPTTSHGPAGRGLCPCVLGPLFPVVRFRSDDSGRSPCGCLIVPPGQPRNCPVPPNRDTTFPLETTPRLPRFSRCRTSASALAAGVFPDGSPQSPRGACVGSGGVCAVAAFPIHFSLDHTSLLPSAEASSLPAAAPESLDAGPRCELRSWTRPREVKRRHWGSPSGLPPVSGAPSHV